MYLPERRLAREQAGYHLRAAQSLRGLKGSIRPCLQLNRTDQFLTLVAHIPDRLSDRIPLEVIRRPAALPGDLLGPLVTDLALSTRGHAQASEREGACRGC